MTVLFVSENPLDRAENLNTVFDAYKGAKKFSRGWSEYVRAAELDYSAVVVDTMPPYMVGKRCPIVFVHHGITGDKLYGYDQPRKYLDDRARGQIDYAVSASDDPQIVEIVASQTNAANVIPLGFPRTDFLFSKRDRKMSCKRTYLYAPTFRDGYEDAPLPAVDWQLVDSLLEDDEMLVIKRHYFTANPICGCMRHIYEAGNMEPSTPYVIGCDVLVTDFSSIMFDAYVSGKPVILATDGASGYLKNRGMYLDYPNGYTSRWLNIAHNERKLVDFMRAVSEVGMTAYEKRICKKVAGKCDGHSTERVIELMEGLL